MRMADLDRKCSLKSLSLFLTPPEAEQFIEELTSLLEHPEEQKHFHIYSADNTREIICSVITEKKLHNLGQYNKLEQQVLSE